LVHLNSQSLKDKYKTNSLQDRSPQMHAKKCDNELLAWIRTRQDEVNQITFKCDLNHLKNQIELLAQLNCDVKNFSCKLDMLNNRNQNASNTQNENDIDNIFSEFKQLCFSIKKEEQNLNSLYELTKLIHQEIKFFNEIEDKELNRDWSLLNKLNSKELFDYKQETEAKISQRKSKISYILGYAERLIKNGHLASNDLNVINTFAYFLSKKILLICFYFHKHCINTIKSEAKWVNQLMSLLEKHLQSLRTYEQVILLLKNNQKTKN
jgi:hypothetical protein